MARRRWPRLRGGATGIRFRFAAALALALAPILVLSAFQSRQAYQDEVRRAEVELIRAAERSASQAQARIDGAVIMLETLRPESVGLYCMPRLREIIERHESYELLARVGRTGRILCASGTIEGSDTLTGQPWFQRLRAGEETVLARAPNGLFSDGPALLAGVRTERPLGAFDGAFLAVIPLSALRPAAAGPTAPEGSEVALVDASGEILTATDASAFPSAGMSGRDLGHGLTQMRDAQGRRRVVAAAPFAGRDVFVVLTAPTQDLFGWALANALGVFVTPLLTWLVAVVSVLVVAERFIIRWLAYLQRIAAIYAKGRFNVRPVQARRAPAEIRSLAGAMDHMAETIATRDAALRESLDEKDALMREIHHRVKNNLQVITSLLNMQQRALKDPAARAAMNDTRQRITALALIYRALYQSETLKRVDIGRFLEDLVGQLIAADAVRGPLVETQVSADALVVDPDKLAPIALWAVEAISNAQKHAFADRGGVLKVRFTAGPETSVLEVEDDGPGLEAGMASGGVGQTLMTAFARQLRGEAASVAGARGGVLARLSFPTPEVAEPAPKPQRSVRNQRPA